MIDPVVQRITNKDGSIDAKQMIQELISARDRIRDLEAELAEWKRMRNEAMAVATSNRERINMLEAALKHATEYACLDKTDCSCKRPYEEHCALRTTAETACKHSYRPDVDKGCIFCGHREFALTDADGHCVRCGLEVEDPKELTHECPPGFQAKTKGDVA